MAQLYAIRSLDETKAYFEHPVLGARLRECTRCVLDFEGRSAAAIFGNPDDSKFQSSMTLFVQAASDCALFDEALRKYFGGERDTATLARLG